MKGLGVCVAEAKTPYLYELGANPFNRRALGAFCPSWCEAERNPQQTRARGQLGAVGMTLVQGQAEVQWWVQVRVAVRSQSRGSCHHHVCASS